MKSLTHKSGFELSSFNGKFNCKADNIIYEINVTGSNSVNALKNTNFWSNRAIMTLVRQSHLFTNFKVELGLNGKVYSSYYRNIIDKVSSKGLEEWDIR